MKFLRNIFDNAHAKLNKSEKTKKYFPLVDAFDTLMFTPNHTTKNGSHIRDSIDLKRTMMFVILALLPCLLFGMYNVGYQHSLVNPEAADFTSVDMFLHGLIRVLPMVVVSYGVGLGVEFIFAIKNGHAVQEGFLVSGMLIPLIMPIDTPLWMVGVSTIFGVVIGKEVFGGTGMNILNVALTTRAFAFFSYPTAMSGDRVWISGYNKMKEAKTLVDGASGATPMGDLASAGMAQDNITKLQSAIDAGGLEPAEVTEATEKIAALSTEVTDFMANVPNQADALMGLYPGSIGETSVYAILIGAAFLLITRIASWRVMFSFFLGGLLMTLLFNQVGGDNPYMTLDPITQLSFGGFFFGMAFMITDPVTACQTNTGKFFYGFLGGSMALLIRVINPAYPEGVMLAILIANVFAPLIDHMVISSNIKKRLKRVKTA